MKKPSQTYARNFTPQCGFGIRTLLASVASCWLVWFAFPAFAQSAEISGTLRDAQTAEPLPFASVFVLPSLAGATTDEAGAYRITLSGPLTGAERLVASYVGYASDTLRLTAGQHKYHFRLEPASSTLSEVTVVSGTMKEISKMNSPIPVEIYTPALFTKNPTPSIFESLSMVNGVQPQLNCNVCNTGDIHINGMEGPYTMVLIDGMPIVSSLATVYGLSGIPNSMVRRIEVVKGPASTLYGSEAVGGLINIITKDPSTAALFHVDGSATTFGEYNLDVSAGLKAGDADGLLGINYFNFANRIDNNGDNFTDVTLQNRLSLFNKWNFARASGKTASLAMRYIYEDRWGGEMQWDRQLRGSDEVYGESIYTNRAELIGNYQLPGKEKRFVDVSYNYHLQDSYYGATPYLADQHVFFTQLRWDKKIGRHDLLFGLPLRYQHYDDNTVGTALPDGRNRPQSTWLPGIFAQDEITLSQELTLLAGMRFDHHNDHGAILSPRLSAKYAPDANNTFRLSAGNGFRVVNLFTEDHAALTGAREVIIAEALLPEESWNVNVNYTRQVAFSSGYLNLDASLFHTYFTNKIVGDFITDPERIIYDNLRGHAVSQGITLNADLALINSFKFIAGVTLMDVYQTETDDNGLLVKTPQLFAPRVSGTYAISYTLDRAGIQLDLTGRLNGPMHLPVVPNDFRPAKSPWFTIMNVQVSKVFSSGWELYGGLKNLLNFIPDDPLLRPFDPFDKNITVDNPYGYTFDTSYNYAPIQGIRGFLGFRYTFQ